MPLGKRWGYGALVGLGMALALFALPPLPARAAAAEDAGWAAPVLYIGESGHRLLPLAFTLPPAATDAPAVRPQKPVARVVYLAPVLAEPRLYLRYGRLQQDGG